MGVARLAMTAQGYARQGSAGKELRPVASHSGRVVKSALVIGSGLSALTVGLALADSGMRVTLVESPARWVVLCRICRSAPANFWLRNPRQC